MHACPPMQVHRLACTARHAKAVSCLPLSPACHAALARLTRLTALELGGHDSSSIAAAARLPGLCHLAVLGVSEGSARELTRLSALRHLASFELHEPMLAFKDPTAGLLALLTPPVPPTAGGAQVSLQRLAIHQNAPPCRSDFDLSMLPLTALRGLQSLDVPYTSLVVRYAALCLRHATFWLPCRECKLTIRVLIPSRLPVSQVPPGCAAHFSCLTQLTELQLLLFVGFSMVRWGQGCGCSTVAMHAWRCMPGKATVYSGLEALAACRRCRGRQWMTPG